MQRVAVGTTEPVYCSDPPFHPEARFPELPFQDICSSGNKPYTLVRQLLLTLGFDEHNFGSPDWNPLGSLMRPGNTVVIKPNFVLSFNAGGDDLFAMITHPSILRAIIDYAYIAVKGAGRIIVADAPQMDCNWG